MWLLENFERHLWLTFVTCNIFLQNNVILELFLCIYIYPMCYDIYAFFVLSGLFNFNNILQRYFYISKHLLVTLFLVILIKQLSIILTILVI